MHSWSLLIDIPVGGKYIYIYNHDDEGTLPCWNNIVRLFSIIDEYCVT